MQNHPHECEQALGSIDIHRPHTRAEALCMKAREVSCCSVGSGGEAAEGFARVEGACEAGAVFGAYGVRAEDALAPRGAGDDGLGLDVGEAVAEGMGVVSGVGQHRAGPVARRRPLRASGAPGAVARGGRQRRVLWSSVRLGNASTPGSGPPPFSGAAG